MKDGLAECGSPDFFLFRMAVCMVVLIKFSRSSKLDETRQTRAPDSMDFMAIT